MRVFSHFNKYTYSLTAVMITLIIAASMAFTLVSGLHHLLWYRMMKGHPLGPSWLWMSIVVLAMIMILFWYRIMLFALKYRQQNLVMENRILVKLLPFPTVIQDELLRVTGWYLLDDETQRYAFTWGAFHSRTCISTGLWNVLDESSRRAVMYHEVAHVLAHDAFQQSILKVLSGALPFLGLGELYRKYMLRREIEADRLAIKACDDDDVPLIKALLVASQSMSGQETRVGLTGAFEARLQFLETRQLPPWWNRKIRYRFMATFIAIFLTAGEGLLVLCH